MPPEPSAQSAIERELFLRSLAVSRPLSAAARQLGRAMREQFFEAGSVIYEAGTPADDVFFIVRGRVKLTKPGAPLWEFGPNSVVGGIDADLERPRARTAVAETNVDALVLSNEDRLDVLEDNFEHTRAMILFIAARLHEWMMRLPNGGFAEPAAALVPGRISSVQPLPLVERVLTLREVPAFSRASIQTLVSLAPFARELRIAAGDTIFRQGEAQNAVFVVAEGLVELERSAPPCRAQFAAASLLGASAAFGDGERLYSARALQDCLLLRLVEEDFFDVMEDHFDLARSVLAYMASERERVQDQLEINPERSS